jgi:hypothetical protein
VTLQLPVVPLIAHVAIPLATLFHTATNVVWMPRA